MFEVFNEHGNRDESTEILCILCAFYMDEKRREPARGPIVRKSHCSAANICSFISQYALEMYMYTTSDALFAFMKNNLFALIKFVSINKYFTSKQASGSSPNMLNIFRAKKSESV